jgi:hypothetical protein
MQTTHEKVIELRKASKSYSQIAKILAISKATVAYHASPEVRAKQHKRRRNLHRSFLLSLKKEYGGCCTKCGYDKCFDALHFHHKDASTKNAYYLGVGEIAKTCSLTKAREEAKKCVLLCANCHIELHHKLRGLADN